MFDRLGTKLAFSTANHPQTDGLTERVNRIVEDVLRAFVNHKQDNWDMLLPLCEFSINSATQSSTGNTPFFLNYGLNPRAPPDFLNPIQGGRDSADWLQARQDAVKISQDALVAAQARQAFYADLTRVEGKLKVGDLVMVYRDFLLTPEARDRPSHKLRPKWFGPFPITQVVGPNAYKLKLPHTSRCHPVFNVSALRAYEKNAIPNRRQLRLRLSRTLMVMPAMWWRTFSVTAAGRISFSTYSSGKATLMPLGSLNIICWMNLVMTLFHFRSTKPWLLPAEFCS